MTLWEIVDQDINDISREINWCDYDSWLEKEAPMNQ